MKSFWNFVMEILAEIKNPASAHCASSVHGFARLKDVRWR
jgi:hypothetical protein